MKNALLIYHLHNLIVIALYAFLLWNYYGLGFYSSGTSINLNIIVFGLVIGTVVMRGFAKRIDPSVVNPITAHPVAKVLHWVGFGSFFLSIVFKVLHFPGSTLIALGCIVLMLIAFVISLTNGESQFADSDILDDSFNE